MSKNLDDIIKKFEEESKDQYPLNDIYGKTIKKKMIYIMLIFTFGVNQVWEILYKLLQGINYQLW